MMISKNAADNWNFLRFQICAKDSHPCMKVADRRRNSNNRVLFCECHMSDRIVSVSGLLAANKVSNEDAIKVAFLGSSQDVRIACVIQQDTK